jgi:hypothetical protein
MSDWKYLNEHRIRTGPFASDPSFGFNGAFVLSKPGEARSICVIASNGMGWRHVSVSFGSKSTKTPSWETMCWVKDLFFEPEDCVMQFHPPRSEYVNFHKGCLHLFKPIGVEMPTPPSILVGPK